MRGFASLLLASALLVGACYTGPSIDHFAGVLDELTVSADWELVKTETRGPDGDFECDPNVVASCPAVTRWYVVDGEASAAFKDAKAMVGAAGFEVDRELIPACDGSSSGPACSFFSSRDDDRVLVTVFRSTSDAGLDDTVEGTTVLVTATGPR